MSKIFSGTILGKPIVDFVLENLENILDGQKYSRAQTSLNFKIDNGKNFFCYFFRCLIEIQGSSGSRLFGKCENILENEHETNLG